MSNDTKFFDGAVMAYDDVAAFVKHLEENLPSEVRETDLGEAVVMMLTNIHMGIQTKKQTVLDMVKAAQEGAQH
jgi:hypothetical protein